MGVHIPSVSIQTVEFVKLAEITTRKIYPFTFNVIINTTDVLLSFAHARRKNLSVYKITNPYVYSSIPMILVRIYKGTP